MRHNWSCANRVADWSVLAKEDDSQLVGFGCKATRLDFFRGGSPPAAIAAARLEGLRTRLERFGGILSLQKNSEKQNKTKTKTNTRNYPEQYSYSERLKENQSWENQKKRQGKPVRQTVDVAAFFLCQDKSNRKLITAIKPSFRGNSGRFHT